MGHPLDGVNAKLAQADTHFEAVKNALQGILDSDPDLIPGEFDDQTSHYVFRAQRDSRSADWLSPVIGDCVHNFRTALDYIVWELVAVNDNVGTVKTEFPIFVDPARYKKWAPQKIWGVPPVTEAIVERLQPFYGPNSDPLDPGWRDPAREPLALLYELDKWDKHRSLNLTEDLISAHLLQSGHSTLGPAILPGRFKRGAILALAEISISIESTGVVVHPGVDVYLRAAYDIAFDRGGPAPGEPVIQTLANIRREVRERVMPAFASLFP